MSIKPGITGMWQASGRSDITDFEEVVKLDTEYIEKWFEFGKDEDGNELPKTVISREFSSEWKTGDEPYYPVNDEKNGALYAEYKKLAGAEEKVIFGGRLGEYKYYDMDAVIASALDIHRLSVVWFLPGSYHLSVRSKTVGTHPGMSYG